MSKPQRTRNWIRIILAIVALACALLVWRLVPAVDILKSTLASVESLGPWGPLALGLIYIVACILLVPGSILTLGAGALFGVVVGSITVSISSTLGATAAFLIGRYLARDAVARRIAGNKTFDAIDKAVGNEGWKIVGLVRLSPIVPFNLANYAFGLTRVRTLEYMLASWIGMLPATILYVYIGSLARDVATLFSEGRTRTNTEWALFAVGLIATAAVTVYVSRVASRILKETVAADGTPTVELSP